MTIESTTRIVKANGGIDCRVWEGVTERGVAVVVLVARIAVKEGQDVCEFEAELKETRAPSRDAEAFPLRMIL
jgi:hypothetical protein